MKKTAKLSLLVGAGLLAACVVWAQSTVIVNQRRAPAKAAMIGIPPQGWVKASLSRALQGARLVKDPKSLPRPLERRLAQEAFAAEPLATSALPVLVQSLAADGKQRQSQRLLTLAGGLTRRDNLVNAMLIDEESKRQRPERAVQLLARAMSVDYDARYFYVERMATATASPGAMDVLAPMLGQNPNWSPDYWVAVLRIPAVMPQAGRVRLRIAGAPWNLTEPTRTDFDLIAELASRKQPALAYDIARTLGMPVPRGGEVLAGSRFDREPRFPPFEWELLQTGDIGTTIEPKSHTLSISSLPAASGIAIRQLAFIPSAGYYRLRWKLSGLNSSPDAALKFRLTCMESGKTRTPVAPVALKDGAGSAVVAIANSTCNWYSVTLELDAAGSAIGTDIAIQQLSLRRDSGGAGNASAANAGN
jgi:hypothetical protein